MRICPDCKTREANIRSNVTGNIYRCRECDVKKEKELGIKREGLGMVGKYTTDFKPYWLKSGDLSKVEKDRNFDKEDRKIFIKSKAHESAVMKEMNCHLGEKGENLLGHKFGYDAPGENSQGTPIPFKRDETRDRDMLEFLKSAAAKTGIKKEDFEKVRYDDSFRKIDIK